MVRQCTVEEACKTIINDEDFGEMESADSLDDSFSCTSKPKIKIISNFLFWFFKIFAGFKIMQVNKMLFINTSEYYNSVFALLSGWQKVKTIITMPLNNVTLFLCCCGS